MQQTDHDTPADNDSEVVGIAHCASIDPNNSNDIGAASNSDSQLREVH